MCGIAALYEPTAPVWLNQVARQMTHLVRHRGPDGEGLMFARPHSSGLESFSLITRESPQGASGMSTTPQGCILALCHRRLAILDLSSAGHQPMTDRGGDIWITFNGEIYNYIELRAELTAAGQQFRTSTDTEVILAAWRQWGEACLARFNGMFAFVLCDTRTQRIFAARDRFGIKPLYFWRTPSGGMAFASEIKQFTCHPRWEARLNGPRAYDFLNWGMLDHTHETFFASVQQLRGGEFFSAELRDLPAASPRRWYELKAAPFSGTFAEAGEQFRLLLDDSVRLRLRADVPVGTCLSGGLDSSAIVCTMREQLGASAAGLQKTFSAYSDVARFDERRFIEEVVKTTGATAHHIVPDPDELLASLDEITWHQDEPFGSTSIWAQWCVFRLAKQSGVVVMLDGQGADEALGGYHGYFGPRLAGLIRQGRWWQFAKESAEIRKLHGYSSGYQTRLLANELLGSAFADRLRKLTGRTVRDPDFLDLTRLGATPRSPHDGTVNLRDPVRSLGHAQLTSLNVPMLLHWEDRDSMAHGVESRLPFLDYRLVEFCLGLPEDFKLSNGWTKRALREGLRGRLPESIRTRRDKLGFSTAEEVWMRERRPDVFLRLVDEAIDAAGGALTPVARTKAVRMLAGGEPFNFILWRFISYGRWLRRFNVKHS